MVKFPLQRRATGWVVSAMGGPRANPAKVEDFGDKDLLQGIDLARILFGEVIPLRRDAR
jgi:hypothetical protein